MSGMDERRAAAEARSKTWWLLSRLFLERPSPAFLAELQGMFSVLQTEGGDDERLLARCLEELDGDLAQRLNVEYTRLFRGIREGYGLPPPYESLYRGDRLMSDVTLAVRRRYEAAGFGDVEPAAGPPDHLGAELRFLALLCFREMEGWATQDPQGAARTIAHQREFLDQHLLAWLPSYAERIRTESREPFYAAIAGLTRSFSEEYRLALGRPESELEVA